MPKSRRHANKNKLQAMFMREGDLRREELFREGEGNK
jgi:hypothetical protein